MLRLWLPWLLCASCGGPEFSSRKDSTTSGGNGGSSGSESSAAAGVDPGGSTASGTDDTRSTPCGQARNDSANYNVEVCIPSGTFSMGSTSANLPTGHVSHNPVHAVTLEAFLIDAYEVTVARYRACVVAGTCDEPGTDLASGCTYTTEVSTAEKMPISCITANQASGFCVWDGGRRLPTEAEWERAAAGTSGNVYPWGATFDCDHAVLAALNACKAEYATPTDVGSHSLGQTPEGLFDLAGNVAEWVKDWTGVYPSTAVTDPQGPSSGTSRIVRGGSYKSLAIDGQTFIRTTVSESVVGANGIRCARAVAP